MYFPEDGAAPAAAEPLPTPQDSGGTAAQLEAGGGSAEATIDRSKETARHSLDRAFAALDAETPIDMEQRRDERGRFKGGNPAHAEGSPDSRQPAVMEAPARFSPDAKAAWDGVPDSVKGEVGRAVRELETGIREYQQVFEPMKPYYQMALENGVELHDAVANYVRLDKALISDNPQERLATIEHLLGVAGITPREYAAFISGQPADQTQSQNDQTIRELREQVAQLQNQLGGVTQSIQQRREDDALRQVEAFADANPRLKEPRFQNSVFRLLHTGMAADLQSAFDMATRLNPLPAETAHPALSSGANPKAGAAQTRNGNLSITGAPGSGSNPAKRKAPASARESVDNAFASLGLG